MLMLSRYIFRGFVLWVAPLSLVALVSTSSAQNVVRLTPPTGTASLGAIDVDLELEIDFMDITSGGGVEISYDATRLAFVSFAFSGDPNFGLMGPVDGEPNQPLEVGAGWFVIVPPFGVAGPHTIGTLRFEAIGVGPASVSTAASLAQPGPFFGPADPSTPLVVTYEAAIVDVAALLGVPAAGPVAHFIAIWALLSVGIRLANDHTELHFSRTP